MMIRRCESRRPREQEMRHQAAHGPSAAAFAIPVNRMRPLRQSSVLAVSIYPRGVRVTRSSNRTEQLSRRGTVTEVIAAPAPAQPLNNGPLAGEAADPPFPELLRSNRVRAGLTQRALADLSTISPRAIRDIEAGRA